MITDVRMPGMDGIELARRIRTERPRLPVIFISAHYNDDVRQRALNEGAVAFLQTVRSRRSARSNPSGSCRRAGQMNRWPGAARERK